MKTKYIVLAGILACGASLHAGSAQGTALTLDFNTLSTSPGLVNDTWNGVNYAISPYTGTVNGTTVQLYCDDFNDSIGFGQQNISVYSTALTNTNTAVLQGDTRYGKYNSPGSAYGSTTGTTLYDEMAWLATQMQHTSGSNAAANNLAIQEAIWALTDASTAPGAPHNSANNTGTASQGLSGTAQSYLTWIADAQAYVTAFNGGASWQYTSNYSALVPSNWYIITAVNSAGCTIGSTSGGCTPGTAGSGSTTQEFLAYYTGGLTTSTTNTSGVPEPATFALIGSGLLAGALIRRRRKA